MFKADRPQSLNIRNILTACPAPPSEANSSDERSIRATAINIAAHEIMVGEGDIMICGGVEIMSHYGMMSDVQVAMDANYPVRLSSRLAEIGMCGVRGVHG